MGISFFLVSLEVNFFGKLIGAHSVIFLNQKMINLEVSQTQHLAKTIASKPGFKFASVAGMDRISLGSLFHVSKLDRHSFCITSNKLTYSSWIKKHFSCLYKLHHLYSRSSTFHINVPFCKQP